MTAEQPDVRPKEAMRILDVSKMTLRSYVDKGLLRVEREAPRGRNLLGVRLFYRHELEALREQQGEAK